MAGGNGFYFAAAALLTSVVLGLLLYQSRWTASARGGGMFGHEGFAPDKRPFLLLWAGTTFKQAGFTFCSLVDKNSEEVYTKMKTMPGGDSLPVSRAAATALCSTIGYDRVSI